MLLLKKRFQVYEDDTQTHIMMAIVLHMTEFTRLCSTDVALELLPTDLKL